MAIVSNNSSVAIESYLAHHKLTRYVDHISARTTPDVEVLKPNPYLVMHAIAALKTVTNRALLIGDSATDMQAGRAIPVSTIGFANKIDKKDKLIKAGAEAVFTKMSYILRQI